METSAGLQPGNVIKPNVVFEDVKNIAFTFYGLEVSKIIELNGYDDKNYHLISGKSFNGPCDEFVLKIINSLDSQNPKLFDAQTKLLLHLRRAGVQCPKPIPTKDHVYFTKVKISSGDHIVRLLEYVKGTIVYNVQITPNLLRQTGEFVARLDMALKDFRHTAYDDHKPFWMLESVPKLRHFLYAVPDESRQKLVLAIVKQFEERVVTVSDTLERGLIHGDFNEQNIIVEKGKDDDWMIKAVIDFGDCHIACYLYEIAITMTYMMLQTKNIEAGGHVLAGYTSVRRLSDTEYSLLKVCIVSRLCQSLVMGAYTHLQDPNNAYVLVTAAHGWALLEKIWKEPEESLIRKWRMILDCR